MNALFAQPSHNSELVVASIATCVLLEKANAGRPTQRALPDIENCQTAAVAASVSLPHSALKRRTATSCESLEASPTFAALSVGKVTLVAEGFGFAT